jgi:hypothetical protein
MDGANGISRTTKLGLAVLGAGLSADAVPALIEALPAMGEPQRATVARTLLTRWSPPARRDWRTWSWGRTRAWRAVEANRSSLGGMGR